MHSMAFSPGFVGWSQRLLAEGDGTGGLIGALEGPRSMNPLAAQGGVNRSVSWKPSKGQGRRIWLTSGEITKHEFHSNSQKEKEPKRKRMVIIAYAQRNEAYAMRMGHPAPD